MDNKIRLDRIEDAIEDFRNGKMVIVVDDEDRENEGDLIMAAEKITPEDVNFMLKNARGVLCAPITQERCRELQLEKQVEDNTSMLGTPFTVTVDKLERCPRPSDARDMSIRCMPRTEACCSAPDIPRPQWICAASPDSNPPAY